MPRSGPDAAASGLAQGPGCPSRKHSGQSPFPCNLRSPPCPVAGAGASWLRMLIRNVKGAAALLVSSRVRPVPPRAAAPTAHKSRAARRAGGGGPLVAPSPFAFWWLLNHEVLVSAAQDHPWSGSWGRDAGKDPGGAAGGRVLSSCFLFGSIPPSQGLGGRPRLGMERPAENTVTLSRRAWSLTCGDARLEPWPSWPVPGGARGGLLCGALLPAPGRTPRVLGRWRDKGPNGSPAAPSTTVPADPAASWAPLLALAPQHPGAGLMSSLLAPWRPPPCSPPFICSRDLSPPSLMLPPPSGPDTTFSVAFCGQPLGPAGGSGCLGTPASPTPGVSDPTSTHRSSHTASLPRILAVGWSPGAGQKHRQRERGAWAGAGRPSPRQLPSQERVPACSGPTGLVCPSSGPPRPAQGLCIRLGLGWGCAPPRGPPQGCRGGGVRPHRRWNHSRPEHRAAGRSVTWACSGHGSWSPWGREPS